MNDKIAIYLRLSLADGDLKKGSKDESNSIYFGGVRVKHFFMPRI